MKVKIIRTLPGTNNKERERLIYLCLEQGEKHYGRIIESYISISKQAGYEESIVDLYNEEGLYNIWLTYTLEEVAISVLQDICNGVEEVRILEKAKELITNCWYKDIINWCDSADIPYINLDNDEIQLGYGIHSFKLSHNDFLQRFYRDIVKLEDYCNSNNIGLIPIISVTGTNGKTTTVRLIYNILKGLGYHTGLSSTGGIYIGDRKIRNGDTTGFYSAREVLKSPEVEVAVLETARGGILKKGLGYKKSMAAIITSLSEDHIGMSGINDIEDLARLKCTVCKELSKDGKLIMLALPVLYDSVDNKDNVCLFDIEKNLLMENHIKYGGEAYYIEKDELVHCTNGEVERLGNIDNLPFTHRGISKSNIKNIMAAIASVSTIHSNITEIFNVIKNINCDLYTNPGRQNIISVDNYKVILDYGHNSEAFQEVFSIAAALNPSSITGIIAAAGDRKNKYISQLGSMAALYCHRIFIREQADLRGREPGESANLIKLGILEEGFNMDNVEEIYKEEEALLKAMKTAKDGEVIVLFTQCLDVIIPVINKYFMDKKLNPLAVDLDFSH